MLLKDPILLFGMLLSIIFFGPVIAKRIKVSELVLFIVAGVLIGPYLFKLTSPENIIKDFGYIGLLYILFIAGLEIDMHRVKKSPSEPMLFGILTFIIPLVAGFLLGFYYLRLDIVSSLLFGSLFSSHTIIPYPIITKLGLVKHRAATTSIGGTIITDILAMLVLALTVSLHSSNEGGLVWIRLFVSLALLVTISFILVPLLARYVFNKLADDENTEFIFVLMIVFLLSYLAQVAGMEKIIGAFLAGIALNNLIPEKSILMNKIKFTGNSIFIPAFLVSVGMIINIKIFTTSKTAIILAILMTVVVSVTKLIASFINGLIRGYSSVENMLVFGLTVNQAAATLAAGLVGYNYGMLSEEILAGIIFMITITCFMGPVITGIFGKKIVLSSVTKTDNKLRFINKILIPLKPENDYKRLIDFSLLMIEKNNVDSLHTLFVKTDMSESNENFLGEKVLKLASEYARGADMIVTTETRFDLNVVSGVNRTTKDLSADALCLEWENSSISPFYIFGSTLDDIVNNSNRSVFINRFVNPINTSDRFIIIIPPYLIRFDYLYDIINCLYKISIQLQTEMVFVSHGDFTQEIEEHLSRNKNKLKLDKWKIVNMHSFSLNCIVESLRNNISQTDHIFLLSERIGRAAWQPVLNKLPSRLSVEFPQHNLTVVFSDTTSGYSILEGHSVTVNESALKPINDIGVVKVSGSAFVDELVKYIRKKFKFSLSENVGKLLQRVLKTGLQESILLNVDTLFLHYHEDFITEPLIVIFVNSKGFSYDDKSYKVVITLLSPVDYPSNAHIKNLQRIVRLVKQPEFIETLLRSTVNLKIFVNRLFKEV